MQDHVDSVRGCSLVFFFFSSRRRHTRCSRDWSSDVCSSDLIAALSGHLTLASQFQWIGTYPALIAFSVATALEIGGYYIPWLDHLLDTIEIGRASCRERV